MNRRTNAAEKKRKVKAIMNKVFGIDVFGIIHDVIAFVYEIYIIYLIATFGSKPVHLEQLVLLLYMTIIIATW